MCLAHPREAKKMMAAGLQEALNQELDPDSMSTLAIKTNCVWAMCNLAGSSLDVRDRILDDDDVIFHRLGRCVEQAILTHG